MPPIFHRVTVQIGLVAAVALTSQLGAAPRFSDWEVPTNLGATVNSSFEEFGPAISKDGLSLFFTSTRPGFGATDIWVSQRASPDDPWGRPVNLGDRVNTVATEGPPSLSRDGHWLFFNSDRPGSLDQDIWVSRRTHVHDDFGWESPVNLGASVNSAFFDAGASLLDNDEGDAALLFFASNRPGGPGGFDLYVSELADNGFFGAPVVVPELSSAALEQRPSVRFDGLELFFHSNRLGSTGNDLWVSTRERRSDPWSTPVNLGSTVNSGAADQQPYIAGDRRTLFFASNRPGEGLGGLDLYVTTRTKAR
jgi:WD40 repeat protein